MNRSTHRMPAWYALLLSLTVAALGFGCLSPAQATQPFVQDAAVIPAFQTTSTTGPRQEPGSPTATPPSSADPTLVEEDSSTQHEPAEEETTGDPVQPVVDEPSQSPDSGSPDGGTGDGSPEPSPDNSTDKQPVVEDSPSGEEPGGSPDTSVPPPAPAPAPAPDVVTDPVPGDLPDEGDGSSADPQDTPVIPDQTSPVPAPLTLGPSSIRTETKAGQDYTAQLKATGGAGEYSYRVSEGALPPGLKLDAETGKISGKAKKIGAYEFTVLVTSGDLKVSQRHVIAVKEVQLQIKTPELEPARAGEAFETVVLQTEGGQGPYTYSIKGSQLPGTSPQTDPLQNRLLDEVQSPPRAVPGSAQLALSDPTPEAADIDDVEDVGTVPGMEAPRPSTLGNLPAGVSLEDGILTGKPEADAAGTYRVTVVSTDRHGSTDEKELTITVLSAGEPELLPDDAATGSPAELPYEASQAMAEAGAAQPDTGFNPALLLTGVALLAAAAGLLLVRRTLAGGSHK